jgi:hypothetical protein
MNFRPLTASGDVASSNTTVILPGQSWSEASESGLPLLLTSVFVGDGAAATSVCTTASDWSPSSAVLLWPHAEITATDNNAMPAFRRSTRTAPCLGVAGESGVAGVTNL